MQPETSSISNFKEFVKKLLFPVLLIVGLATAVFNWWFEKKIILGNPSCGAYKINRILTNADRNEIPIFGSSRAETSFIPELLDSRFFNYGLEGTQENVMMFFIEQECKKKDKASPLIIANIDLDGIDRKNGDLLNYLYNSRDPDVKPLINEYEYYHSVPFVRYLGQFENYFRYYLNNRTQLSKYAKDGAFIEKTVLPKKMMDDLIEYRRTHQDVFKHDPGLKKKFFQTLTLNPDRYFVFVVPPYHSCYFSNYKNPQDARAFLNELRTLNNVRVFDFSGVIYPDSLFINTTHLNYNGALRFTKEFRDSLSTLKNINFN
jgi:hypothetical protein